MVLLNYEEFIEQRIEEQKEKIGNRNLLVVCRDPDFKDLMIKLYEYCEQINIIEQRMDILAKETQKIKGLKPQLLESEVTKIQQKTKQISSIYSAFLFKQPKFKVRNQQAIFYESLIRLMITILEQCFSKQDYKRLRKQVNRLIRTNTFNKKICWEEFVQKNKSDESISIKKKKMVESDYRKFRFSVLHERSQIRPYVNNRSSFRTTNTRSPMISLLYPTNQYMSFKLSRKNRMSMKPQRKLTFNQIQTK